MRSLLVLGGADGALTTLRTARDMGLHTICVDLRGDAPGAAVADELLNVSSRDVDAVVDALAARPDGWANVAGVLSPASDVNVPSRLAIATRLGLRCGLSDDAVRASVDKGFFRSMCERLGSPGPWFVQGRIEDVVGRVGEVDAPVMVKPTDSSGSRGITKVTETVDLRAAVEYAASWSSSGVVIVEEFLPAEHYSVEALVRDSAVELMGLTERRLTEPPYFVTAQHLMSAGPGGDVRGLTAQVRPLLDELCRRLDYRWGALNLDLMVTGPDTVVFGEWGARLGGNGSAELLTLATGVDATAANISMAIGDTPDLTARFDRVAGSRVLGASVRGKLVDIAGLDAARAIPGVADLVLAVEPGDHVEPYTQAGRKLGYALASGPDRATVLRALDDVEAALEFTVEPPALVY